MKLSWYFKDRVIEKVMSRFMVKEFDSLAMRCSDLAYCVLHELYSKEELEDMAKIPDGWLVDHDRIVVNIGKNRDKSLFFGGNYTYCIKERSPWCQEQLILNKKHDVRLPCNMNEVSLNHQYSNRLIEDIKEFVSDYNVADNKYEGVLADFKRLCHSCDTIYKLKSLHPDVKSTCEEVQAELSEGGLSEKELEKGSLLETLFGKKGS